MGIVGGGWRMTESEKTLLRLELDTAVATLRQPFSIAYTNSTAVQVHAMEARIEAVVRSINRYTRV